VETASIRRTCADGAKSWITLNALQSFWMSEVRSMITSCVFRIRISGKGTAAPGVPAHGPMPATRFCASPFRSWNVLAEARPTFTALTIVSIQPANLMESFPGGPAVRMAAVARGLNWLKFVSGAGLKGGHWMRVIRKRFAPPNASQNSLQP